MSYATTQYIKESSTSQEETRHDSGCMSQCFMLKANEKKGQKK